jgi:DNA ligase (NAD+)
VRILRKLEAAGVWPKAEKDQRPRTGRFSGMTFVVTGTLPGFSREAARKFIEKHGGKVTDSVSRKTDYLVLGADPGSKLQKAKSLGVKTVDEAHLKKLAQK